MTNILVTTPWRHSFIVDRLPANKIINHCNFLVDERPASTDVWIIWGGLPGKTMQISCRETYYITEEVHDQRKYHPDFLLQFDHIITNREDISHPSIICTHELGTWHCGPTYDECLTTVTIPKTRELSVVCSDLIDLLGHKKRYAFVNKLIGHFKDRLHVYGRGFNPIHEKWDALLPYKYSIAIENNRKFGYFSEKLTECFLTHTLPIYYGAPDISDYFDKDAMCLIDPDDFLTSVQTIESLLDEKTYEKQLLNIIQQKKKYLEKYHIFQALSRIVKDTPVRKKQKKIHPEFKFTQSSLFKRITYRLLDHIH